MASDFMVADKPMLLDRLEDKPTDSLLALIALCDADPRPDKIDVGVGVYRDAAGSTPILKSVKAAERILLETQETKAYLGSQGDARFTELIRPIVFGEAGARDERIVGVQTPGGCGALRLGAELIHAAAADARIFVGQPTWLNHTPLIGSARVEMVDYPYYDRDSHTILFDRMIEALRGAQRGDLVLLHGCCHNPTGADLSPDQWRDVAEIVSMRGLVPYVDLAYQGFGNGLEPDAAGTRLVVEAAEQAIVAQSCDKNFGLYRERTGALFVKAASAEGARIRSLRDRLGAFDPALAYIAEQKGMFSLLPLSQSQVLELRASHGIYMAPSGRFNVVGLSDENVDRFAAAVVEKIHG